MLQHLGASLYIVDRIAELVVGRFDVSDPTFSNWPHVFFGNIAIGTFPNVPAKAATYSGL